MRDGRHESFERRSAQISELEKEAPYYFCHLLDPIQKTLKECIQYEQEKKERDEAERSQLLAHRSERERLEDEERVRREREHKQQEIEAQFQAKRAQTRLRRVKADADRECRRAWIENLQLVILRRANQAANAG